MEENSAFLIPENSGNEEKTKFAVSTDGVGSISKLKPDASIFPLSEENEKLKLHFDKTGINDFSGESRVNIHEIGKVSEEEKVKAVDPPITEKCGSEEEVSIVTSSKLNRIVSSNHTELGKLLIVEQKLKQLASQDIIYSPALISRALNPAIRRGTINVIQGPQGSHKSRLAAILTICLIKSPIHDSDTLGYEKVEGEDITVIYFDTERNQEEEFAEALQIIVRNAGYNSPEEIPNFRFTSLKSVPKKNRFDLIKAFVDSVRCETTNPLFIVIDVVTDIIENFNNPAQSMALLDYLGNLAESQLATILLTIHENPGSNKARGHAGTEAINKASYAVSIAFQLDKQGERTNVIWLKEVKNRHAERIEPVALEYDDETKLLKLGDPDYARWILNQNRIKPNAESYLVKLAEYLVSPMDQQTLIGKLMTDFSCSENTVRNRLKEIELKNAEIYVDDKIFNLRRISVNGKSTTYELCEVGNS